MSLRTVPLPDGNGQTGYTLGAEETFTLTAATWRQSVLAPLGTGAIPELVAYAPSGEVIARIEGPALTAKAPDPHGWTFLPVS